ncbi:MAG: O-antigen ligase family protein [Erythrobacter sp.]|uniref:O-antigen ligase family protein n=1 Tax=Erythrobacter sp. TaxID=1042 RepID=UPI0025E36F84|nr:O-antigen ligase family protein [Erythrobacter sp.]MCL9999367.1 O-antigen ligase family protein [Erythrobacter sp.]
MPAGSEPFGFERLPVTGLAAAIIAALAAPALGPAATVVQLACLAAILSLRWRRVPRLLLAGLPLLALALFAAASVLWSDVPAISLRYGLQLVVTAVMGVALGRLLTLRELVLAVFIGTTIACLAGLASGRGGMSEGGPVLIGLAGSKNQISYFALFWLGSSLCVMASSADRPLTRIAAALALVPAAFLIVQGDSATALVSAVVLAGLLGLLALAALLGRGGRLFALVAAALLAIPAAVALPQIEREISIIQTDVLGKDQRLTGRTLLWEEADSLIRQAPVVGHGYKAIWLGPKGKGLLARNGQTDGRAFHFHDTFRELLADLGIIGLVLFLLPLAYAALRSVLLLVAAIDAPRAFAVATLFIILLRVRTELVVGPFLMETVLLTALVAALAALPLAAPQAAPALAPRRPVRRPSSKSQRTPA